MCDEIAVRLQRALLAVLAMNLRGVSDGPKSYFFILKEDRAINRRRCLPVPVTPEGRLTYDYYKCAQDEASPWLFPCLLQVRHFFSE